MTKRYFVRASTEFSAAHVLHGYPGACERVHGHNFVIEAVVEVRSLDAVGMALDFTALQRCLAEIAQPLDHRLLNDVPPFDEVNPTAENLGAYVWTRLVSELPALAGGRPARLAEVTVRENAHTSVTYVGDHEPQDPR
jgi:6-pyruvoyltetrahydropterin/6-carboxytetrahydropterin synthase